jgi:chitin synthase
MVLVATAAQILKSGILDPSAIFLPTVGVIFMVTGCLHPNEMLNLIHGFLYLVTIPGGYLLLVTYAMCNLHVVSWGTRETAEVIKKNPNQNGAVQPLKTGEQHIDIGLGIDSFHFRS